MRPLCPKIAKDTIHAHDTTVAATHVMCQGCGNERIRIAMASTPNTTVKSPDDLERFRLFSAHLLGTAILGRPTGVTPIDAS